MLEVSNLSRRYGDFTAVNRVSFRIGNGEIVGLLGHNGAGKTTIMKMLSGYLEPDNGEVSINGLSLAADAKKIQRLLGYLPENLPVYPEMSVADYLDYAAELKGLTGTEKTTEIKRAIAATDIEDKLLSPIVTLSRGYKQRVGVAQAILGKPKILILDEPTNGLDPTQTNQMRQLIRSIAKEATVILSTHIMQEVDAICDRVLIVRHGELIVDESLNQLRNSNRLCIETSMQPGKAESLFNKHPMIKQTETIAQENHSQPYRYLLTLNHDASQTDASAELAKQIISNGESLYRLHPEQRDLESLFREVSQVNTAEDLNHAA